MIEHSLLRSVEQSIVLFFVLREMEGKGRCYNKGIKELANEIGRHEKSVRNAIDSLQEMKLITTQKNQNVIMLEHTLSDEELYSRMAFIDYMLSQSQPFQELKNDLNQEITRLEEEIELAKEEIARKEEQNKRREKVIQQITTDDIEVLVDRLLAERTYENVNMTNEAKIEDDLERFRVKMFSKYGGADEREEVMHYD